MMFFFFKQKTAYEMRISDWSSDVCSSDLRIEEVVTMSDPITNDRPVFTGQPIPLAVRVPEELARFLELLSDINGRSKTDEYRVALENHVIAAKSDKRVKDRR